jgi:YHS domain-containing protein
MSMQIKRLSLVLVLVLVIMSAYAQQEADKRQKEYNLESGLAIQGYDPVSYFSNAPKKGKKELNYAYQGVTYRFATQANLDAFKKNPAKYEPTYGGWCAYAMGATGEKVEIDPETYKIVDGKLYLFYNKFFNNTLPKWNKEEMELKKKADANWSKTFH